MRVEEPLDGCQDLTRVSEQRKILEWANSDRVVMTVVCSQVFFRNAQDVAESYVLRRTKEIHEDMPCTLYIPQRGESGSSRDRLYAQVLQT